MTGSITSISMLLATVCRILEEFCINMESPLAVLPSPPAGGEPVMNFGIALASSAIALNAVYT